MHPAFCACGEGVCQRRRSGRPPDNRFSALCMCISTHSACSRSGTRHRGPYMSVILMYQSLMVRPILTFPSSLNSFNAVRASLTVIPCFTSLSRRGRSRTWSGIMFALRRASVISRTAVRTAVRRSSPSAPPARSPRTSPAARQPCRSSSYPLSPMLRFRCPLPAGRVRPA